MRKLYLSVSGIENVKYRQGVGKTLADAFVLNVDLVVLIDRDLSLIGQAVMLR